MATPQARAMFLTTTDALFENSGDNKLILTGQPLSVDIAAVVPFPLTGSAGFTGSGMTALIGGNRFIHPGVGSILATGQEPSANEGGFDRTVNPTLGSISFTGGDAPTILAEREILVPATSLTLALQQAYRRTGLEFEYSTPTPQIEHNRDIGTATATLTTYQPQVLIGTPGSHIAAPDTRDFAFTGRVPGLNRTARPIVGNMDLLRFAPDVQTTGLIKPGRKGVLFTGYAPNIDNPSVIVTVTDAEGGTSIVNNDAGPDDGHYEICDRSGFKAKPGELVEDWEGLFVLPEFNEPRNQQDFITSRPEQLQTGSERPEPVGDERFIEIEYSSGVSADDL